MKNSNEDTPENRTTEINEIILSIDLLKIDLNKIDKSINKCVNVMAKHPINRIWADNQYKVNKYLTSYNYLVLQIKHLNTELSKIKLTQGELLNKERNQLRKQ